MAGRENFEEAMQQLMEVIASRVAYFPGKTSVECSAVDVWRQSTGVCQDHAHVMIAACRSSGIPARYVSGYLYTGDSGHAASHAWAEVWDGGQWLSCDTTHHRFTDSAYCRLAVGRDYLDACPVRGVRRGGWGEIMQATVWVDQSQYFSQQ